MADKIAVSKAAAILGVSRRDLQQLIRQGQLHADNGQLDVEELSRLYPRFSMEECPELERVKVIKATSFGRRVASEVAPETDELELRLAKRDRDLAVARAEAKRFRALAEGLIKELERSRIDANSAQLELLESLMRWITAHNCDT
ncbi:MAG: hypothetical protein HQL48_07060 [Gammaproteobacteria bacterium]|nr:hypothetical protein [Gammaproteobacteria bacterium]